MENLKDYIEYLKHLKRLNKTSLTIDEVIISLSETKSITSGNNKIDRPTTKHKYTKEEWYQTCNTSKERGVRTIGGYIATIPKPGHYPGQDERYELEIQEYEANVNLITQAPKMHQLCEAFFDMIKNTKNLYLPILSNVLNEVNPKN